MAATTPTKEKPRQTLEQQRAQDAWECAGAGIAQHYKDYVNDAKGLPALIMNSGLMQVMAYLEDKGGRHHTLAQHLRRWLHQRFPQQLPSADFPAFMQALMKVAPGDYQAITAEAFAWLRWLRQMAAARNGAGGKP
ncbi:MAG: type III-B CRISPR module-associated protein Cmr5 [Immundisolibacter sp.]|jgi:CRISPR-associated protein Cmr5|uniref:type III-B CRISPR module-associated protein Cmr5 n=1 Tax=Immundisolibacter sp. TaxID=1934948 RepID=UPI0019AB1FA5|nr:type III-B CRISPR module-associated protein Cmr5 [Immundisolibacter sp.]MBC7162736.1 type III-B CRISPR module-associated protein Cmr5 [Immundisolibacter sp.]